MFAFLHSAKLVFVVLGCFCLLLSALNMNHPKIHFGWLGALIIAIGLLLS